MKQWNNVTSFLLPGFRFLPNDVDMLKYFEGLNFEDAFLCPQYKTKYDIYLKFDIKQITFNIVQFSYKIKELKGYKGKFFDGDSVVFIIEYPSDKIESVYVPFINGHMGKIVPIYREVYFNKVDEGKINKRWAILGSPTNYKYDVREDVYKREL